MASCLFVFLFLPDNLGVKQQEILQSAVQYQIHSKRSCDAADSASNGGQSEALVPQSGGEDFSGVEHDDSKGRRDSVLADHGQSSIRC